MGAIEKFITISQESKFKGWPLVGDYSLGAKIPFFGQTLEYNLETGNGVEHYVSILRYFGWCVVFGVTAEHEVITLVQWKPGVNQASWELPPGGIGKIPPDMSHEHILETARSFYLQETGYGVG